MKSVTKGSLPCDTEYCIITDAAADLDEDYLNIHPDVRVIPMHVVLGGQEYIYGPGGNLSQERFYELLKAGSEVSTSQINIEVYMRFFRTVLIEEMDILYYVRGGRISKTAGAVGSMLGICPLLNMSNDGKLIPREKIRSKKRVISAIVEKMAQFADNREQYAGRCYISYSGKPDSAMHVKELVKDRFPNVKSLEVYQIGTIIGSHSGPGTVALFFWGDERTE